MPPLESDENIDWYDVLGCTLGSTKEQISKAARKLALIYHPDKNSEPTAAAIFLRIQKAKEFLLDDEKRKEYDDKIRVFVKRKEYDNQRTQNMDSNRKKMRDEFESRLKEVNEREKDKTSRNLAFQKQPMAAASSSRQLDPELDKFRRDGMERRERASQEAQEKNAKKTEFMESRKNMVKVIGLTQIKIKWKRTRRSHSDDSLYQLFKVFGQIEDVTLTGDKGNSALLTFSTEESARKALESYATAEDMRVTLVSDGRDKKPSTVFSHMYEKYDTSSKFTNKLSADDIMSSLRKKNSDSFATFIPSWDDVKMDLDDVSHKKYVDGRKSRFENFVLKEKDLLSQILVDLSLDEKQQLLSACVY